MKNMHNSLIAQIRYSITNPFSWLYGAWIDLKNKYRRTTLGLGWNFMALFITVMIMSLVWSLIFKMEILILFPYIFNGFAIFFFITNSMNISCYSIAQVRKDIYLNISIPVLVLTLRDVSQQFLTYIHYVIFILIMYFYLYEINVLNLVLYFFGLFVVFLQTVFICLLLSFAGTRFRDVAALVTSILSAATILTPIIWKKTMLDQYANYVYLNPLSFMVEIVRDPIIGQIPSTISYSLNFLFLFLLISISYLTIKFKGSRLVFWI